MKKSHSENTVGFWAKQKLDALESYLIAYQNVMLNTRFRTVFVDAFAGAGTYRVRSNDDFDWDDGLLIDQDDLEGQEEYIKGSPLRALGLERPFRSYVFIDADPVRTSLLTKLRDRYPDARMTTIEGDANTEVQKLASRFQAWDLRGVAFLDPYGAHLHWETVRALAATGKFDVIINCPIHMAINRLVKRDGEIPQNWKEQLDAFFGTREWYDVSYDTRDDLFGAGDQFKRADAAERQLSLYIDRLKGVFECVSKPSLVKGPNGLPLYYLIWASGNRRGLKIAEHILGLGDQVKVPQKRPKSR